MELKTLPDILGHYAILMSRPGTTQAKKDYLESKMKKDMEILKQKRSENK